MYKRILVSTDGSKLSEKAIRTAVKLAGTMRAKVIGVFVMAPWVASAYGEGAMYAPALSPKQHKELTEREAKKALAAVEIEARTAEVPYAALMVTADNPWEGIVDAAKTKRADLVVMASHGRRGLAGLILGSETTKVLTHSKIPVLVCR